MKRLFLILSVLAPASMAHAEPVPAPAIAPGSPFALVQQLMARQQWQAAQVALHDAAQDPAADPIEILFLGGMIAIGNQNYASAIEQFQKILISRPNIARVRLELARAYFLAGNDEGAQYHFERVLASNLPEPVAANVQHFLAQIRARRSWQFGFNFALLPDSNVNQGTSAQTIESGPLAGWAFSSDTRETSGIGVQWRLFGEKRWEMADQWRFTISGDLQRKDYGKHRYNDMTIYSRVGPRYLFEGGDTGFGISLGKRLFGDHPYSNARGLFVDMNRQFGERWLAHACVESQQYRFANGKGEPGSLNSACGKLRYMLSPVSLVEGGLDLTRDTTINEVSRHKIVGLSFAYRSEAPFGLLYGVNVYTSRSRYPVFQGMFNRFRTDELVSCTVDLTKRDWKIFDFSPTVGLTVTHNNSTIELYSYRRTLGQFGFTRQF